MPRGESRGALAGGEIRMPEWVIMQAERGVDAWEKRAESMTRNYASAILCKSSKEELKECFV
jgi:hypothetical protein